MSEPIPESIPTSYDPRTKRPTKKRALSPRSQTAASISTLFAKPEKALLDLPPSATSTAPSHQPPEIVQNVQGSSAGAGSGEFHVYKASRRREYERLRGMEEEVEKEQEDKEWEAQREERRRADEEKTRKKRERRGKNKNKDKRGKDGAEKANGDESKAGKLKPRVIVKEGGEGLGGEGPEEEVETAKVVKEVGVVIHDDD